MKSTWSGEEARNKKRKNKRIFENNYNEHPIRLEV